MTFIDNLSYIRKQYLLPENQIYLCGHSLGAMPKIVVDRINNLLISQWGEGLVKSWNDADWINLPIKVAAKIAKLIGASGQEVMVADSLSVNLYKLLHAALIMQNDRNLVIIDEDEFPADLYIAAGVVKQYPGKRLLKVNREHLLESINEQVAVIIISQVNYRDSKLIDIKELAKKSKKFGALTIIDLAHSAGIMKLDLNSSGIDMAVGCTYKYLNGGPGSPGFLFVASRHQKKAKNVIQGWMGHKEPFAFSNEYVGADNISKFAGGTPAILSLSALNASLDLILAADLTSIRSKSLALTARLMGLLLEHCKEIKLLTPLIEERGSHVAFYHQQGYEISRALADNGVIADYRAPGVIRFGIAPLYNNLNDVELAAKKLADIIKNNHYHKPLYKQQLKVT